MNRNKILLVLGLALGAGGVASYLAVPGPAAETGAPVAEARKVTVVVAARDLAPGAVLTAGDVQVVEWEMGARPAGLLGAADEAVGQILTVALRSGEPVLSGGLSPAAAGAGLAGVVPEGMRAISVPVDPVVGVNGFIAPGSRVDVLATMETSGDAVARVVLQGVKALAVGHQLQADASGAPQEVPVVTLQVTPEEAERLILAMHRGRIQLALRNGLDQATVATAGARSSQLTGAPRPAATAAAATAPSPAAPSVRSEAAPRRVTASAPARTPAPAGREVEVINGSARSVVSY